MKKIRPQVTKVVNNFVDSSSGEILSTDTDVKVETIIVDSAESFFMTYVSMQSILLPISNASSKVLWWICNKSQYNTNVVHLGKTACELIEKDTGLKYQTIKNSISELKRLKVLISFNNRDATYRVNPKYFWKGSNNDRKRVMKYVLEVECPGCL